MTDGNYQLTFKVLGKLAKLYDLAAGAVSDLTTCLQNAVQQIADQDDIVLDVALSSLAPSVVTTLNNGPTSTQQQVIYTANAFLITSSMRSRFIVSGNTNPAATVSAVLNALATEMASGGGGDNKKLTTLASTGIVNFLNAVGTAAGMSVLPTWNTAAPGDYPDGTYCVTAVV
ncbi:MAG: hypothetical protein ABSE73_11815 [Planctomycetota bacterium]